jgi:hypothetical protein
MNKVDLVPIVNDIKNIIAESIINSGHSATGAAVDSLKLEYGDDYIAIVGNSYINHLQTGTPPHKGKALSPIANNLKDGWLQARGLPEELAYPIAKSIVTNGSQTYRKGGEDIWNSNVMNYLQDHMSEYFDLKLN